MEKKYVVKVFSLFSNFIETNAIDEKDAIQKVKKILFSEKSTDETKLSYEGTLPETHWIVATEEDLEKLQQPLEEQPFDNIEEVKISETEE
jgi:hypothetical protein